MSLLQNINVLYSYTSYSYHYAMHCHTLQKVAYNFLCLVYYMQKMHIDMLVMHVS